MHMMFIEETTEVNLIFARRNVNITLIHSIQITLLYKHHVDDPIESLF